MDTAVVVPTPRMKSSSARYAPKFRETNIAAISNRLTKETDALAAETNVAKLVKDLKLIQQTQWVVSALALFGLAFGIRIHEFCDRGYQPTEVRFMHVEILSRCFNVACDKWIHLRAGGDSGWDGRSN